MKEDRRGARHRRGARQDLLELPAAAALTDQLGQHARGRDLIQLLNLLVRN